MVEEKLNDILSEMDWRLKKQGLDIKMYMQFTGQTEEQMRDTYRVEAANNIKTELVIEEIIKAENVEADEKDSDAMLEEYAKSVGKTLEKLKADFTEAQLAYFQHRSKINKVLDMLWDSAKVTDDQAEEAENLGSEKKPAVKKAAPKKAAAEEDEAEKPAAKKAPAKAKKTATKKDAADDESVADDKAE